MSNTVSIPDETKNSFWWQGALYEIKARAEETGGVLGLVEGSLYEGFGPPLHVHHREDEAIYVIEGKVRFLVDDRELLGGPGTWVWGPREVAHAFKVESQSARILVIATPGGFERMFEVGGVPLTEASEPPASEYDPEEAIELSKQFGFDVIGPQL
jgi:quercetin dioxygenase-like cupin family protein